MRASAPGKLMLFGEYAVLAGGISIVAAVRASVHATLRPDPTGYATIGPDLSADTTLPRLAIEATGAPAAWLDRLSCDVRAMFHGDDKLGLGSSAASTVALVKLLRAAQGLPDDPMATFRAAAHAHRLLQRGRGSNADVAASAFDDRITYQLDAPQAPFPALGPLPPEVAITRLPPLPLTVHAIWLGAPASSTQLIGRIEQALANPATMAALHALDQSARRAADAIRAADPAALLHEVRRSDQALEDLGAASHAPIITPAHRDLRAWIATHGATTAATKPSGAGGGDFSLLFTTDPTPPADLPTSCRYLAHLSPTTASSPP
jgi:phosphomevalonate kinase